MDSKPSAVHCDPEILGGIPVFVGTRVPFQNLIDYLKADHTLSEFLDDFPSVSRDQALAALEEAQAAVLRDAERKSIEERRAFQHVESDPRFLARIDAARQSLREGRGVLFERVPEEE